MSWRVLVTARAFWASGDSARESMVAAGCEVVNSPVAGPIPEPELIQLLQGCDAVIGSSDPYTPTVFSACPQLKLVARCGVGIDSVDLPGATEAGVIVTNTPGAMTDAVADYTFGLILCLARHIAQGHQLMKEGGWGEFPGTLVFGKTLGLVGFGLIGQSVARRAVGFDMPILVFDPAMEAISEGLANMQCRDLPVKFTTLDELLAKSDIVSLHAPNVPETRDMFNAETFAKMQPHSLFINTARGALVDDAALIAALETGTIAGAAVDVYKREPCPADHPLRSAPNCLLTPHNAFNAVEAAETMSTMCADAVLTLVHGNIPNHVCNPEVLDHARILISGETDAH